MRIRTGPGTNYKIIGKLKKGSTVNIISTKSNWGKISNNKGWICLDYCKKIQDNKRTPGVYIVTASALRVRTGPGTQYKIKTKVYKNSKQVIDYTKNNWGHLLNNKGWICLDYCKRKL